jgi:hypothetical protein
MATKEKTKKRQTAANKVTPMKKSKRVPSEKNIAKKNAAPKKVEAKKKADAKKTTGDKTAAGVKKQVRRKSLSVDTEAFALEEAMARSGEQSGDLQGLSNVQGADSESVDELLEEGNTFEAEAVKGVEDAGDADEAEVRTHEVPQDDVPGEYQDKK